MKTVTIDVQPLTDTLGKFTQPWKSDKASSFRDAIMACFL
jgi:hypothetical protein